MADNFQIVDSKAVNVELDKIIDKTDELVVSFKEFYTVSSDINSMFKTGLPKDFTKAQKENIELMKLQAKLMKENEALRKKLDDLEVKASGGGTNSPRAKRTQYEMELTRQLNKEDRERAKIQIEEERRTKGLISTYASLENRMNSYILKQRDLAVKKAGNVALTDKESKEYDKLTKIIQRYDAILKAADTTVGKSQRSVGNYKIAFDPLSHSLNQLTREAPAFAVSMQTGFLALSNNIPIFFDAVEGIIQKNKALRAEGKQTNGFLKQLASSVFSLQTGISIGVTLLTLYGKDIVEFGKNLFSSQKNIDKVTESLERNGEQMASAFSTSVGEFKKLQAEWNSLGNNLNEKKKFIDDNKSSFENLGIAVNNVSTAEKLFGEQSTAFIEILKIRSKAVAQYQLAVEDYKNASLEEGKSSFDANAFKRGVNAFTSLLGFDAFDRFEIDYRSQTSQLNELGDERMSVYQDLMTQADKLQEGLGLGKPHKTTKDNSFKDYLKDLDAIRDRLLALNEMNFSKLKITEQQYLDRAYKVNYDYYTSKIAFIKGKNAQERKLKAEAMLDLEKMESKYYKDVYDLQMKSLNKQYEASNKLSEKQENTLLSNEYITETDRYTQAIKGVDDRIALTQKEYEEKIQIAKDNYQLTIDLETERDNKLNELAEKRFKYQKDLQNGIKTDYETQLKIDELLRGIVNNEEKRAIINNSSLTYKQRQIALQRLDLENNLEALRIEKKKLETEQKVLAVRLAMGVITQSDKVRIKELEKLLSDLGLKIEESEKGLRNFDLKTIAEGLKPAVESITKGFQDLGLSNIADEFSSIYDRILTEGEDFKMSYEDIFKAASVVVADFANQLVTSQKEHAISALDEQLKYSQATTEQELEFIYSRLNGLNALQDATAEQITEREALEDEARTLKEQQQQREKQIAIQKAKAEQRANAQQALINGALGATKTIASASALNPATWIAAGTAIAFGALQAGIIMAKNPVPEYYVGTSNARQGYAWTQERGAEIHTDRFGNIKTLGDDGGARLTYMESGDKVYTAEQSRKMLEGLEPNYKSMMFQGGIMPINIDNRVNEDKIIKGVGSEFEKVMKQYDKTNVYELNGKVYKENGKGLPVLIGDVEKEKQVIVKVKSKKFRD